VSRVALILLAVFGVMAANQAQATGPGGQTILPRAYFGLGSVGFSLGYHFYHSDVSYSGWFGSRSPFTSTRVWAYRATVLDLAYFLNSRWGFGLTILDMTLDPQPVVTNFLFDFYAFSGGILVPNVRYVVSAGPKSFHAVSLQVMPYLARASSIAVDYSWVPLAPWPIEGRARIGVFKDWGIGDIGCQLSAGVQIGLGCWFMRK
jgi:hypothetical protein